MCSLCREKKMYVSFMMSLCRGKNLCGVHAVFKIASHILVEFGSIKLNPEA